jgi:Tfp pilus assembly protein PilF
MFSLAGTLSVASAASGKKKKKKQQEAESQNVDPLYSLTLMRQGSILIQQEQYHEALQRFEEADKIAPGNATVHNMIGLTYLQLNQHDKALAAFNNALALIPSYSDARNNRGVTYLALEQYHLAEVDFFAVIGDATYPHRWQVFYNLGMTYLGRDQLGAAEENFRKAISAPTPVADAYLRLSQIAQMQERTDQAVDILEEARLQYPDNPDISMRLGQLLMELGRPEEAQPHLEAVIASEPGSDRAHEAAQLLRIH